jgi:hypothetical protein
MWMKRTIFGLATVLVVFVAVFAVLVLRPVRKVKAGHHRCSERTLSGNYGLSALGIYIGYNRSFSMLATFDGKGGFSGSSFDIVDAGFEYIPDSFTGSTYTVNPDCTCTLTIPGPYGPFTTAITLNGIVVDTGGDEVVGSWYETHESTSGSFDMKKVPDSD